MRRGIQLFAILSLVLVALAPTLAGQEAVPLPVRKVVLYKNGMGYFEHVGAIRGRQTVEIVLPSAQLNDVLKVTHAVLVENDFAHRQRDSASSRRRRGLPRHRRGQRHQYQTQNRKQMNSSPHGFLLLPPLHYYCPSRPKVSPLWVARGGAAVAR